MEKAAGKRVAGARCIDDLFNGISVAMDRRVQISAHDPTASGSFRHHDGLVRYRIETATSLFRRLAGKGKGLLIVCKENVNAASNYCTKMVCKSFDGLKTPQVDGDGGVIFTRLFQW